MTPGSDRAEASGAAGGRANTAGTTLQQSVAAWAMAHMLAEEKAAALFGWPSSARTVFVRTESEQAVDDVMIGSSTGGVALVQAKTRFQLTQGDGPLRDAIAQCCRQLLGPPRGTGNAPWNRPLDETRDRLVLATTSGSPTTIRHDLGNLLEQCRLAGPHVAVDERAFNAGEKRALDITRQIVQSTWDTMVGRPATEEELARLLQLLRVRVFNFGPDGADLREVLGWLRSHVLREPTQDAAAWSVLTRYAARLGEVSGGATLDSVRSELRARGIALQEPPSFTADIARLKEISERTAQRMASFARLQVGHEYISIERDVTTALVGAASEGSFVVVGEPGAGKSGALHDAFRRLHDGGRNVVLLAAEDLPVSSVGALRAELRLEHDLVTVLEHWEGAEAGILMIDALDAARFDAVVRTLRIVLQDVRRRVPYWHVVVTVRTFELRYDVALHELFRGEPLPMNDPEFAGVRHMRIPLLDDQDLVYIAERSAVLRELLQRAPEDLRSLLRSPFNLRLAADLLGSGTGTEELLALRTRSDLLDQYWRHRVAPDSTTGGIRESALRVVVDAMVDRRALRASGRESVRPETAGVITALLSEGVLVEWRGTSLLTPGQTLAFSHHVLFDEAVARLVLDDFDLPERLGRERDLSLSVRPSVERSFERTWHRDPGREVFWGLVLRVLATEGIPEVGRLVGPAVAVKLARSAQDFAPLRGALSGERRPLALAAWRYLTNAALASEEALDLAGTPWAELLEQLTQGLDDDLAEVVRGLLYKANQDAGQPPPSAALGRAAREFLTFVWDRDEPSRVALRTALDAVCVTYTSEPMASHEVLARAFEIERLVRVGYETVPALARHATVLLAADPAFLAKLFTVAFTFEETSEASVPLSSGTVLPLRFNRRQSFEIARSSLEQVFPQFLEEAQEQAVCTLLYLLELDARRASDARPPFRLVSFPYMGETAWTADVHGYDFKPHGSSLRGMVDAFAAFARRAAQKDEPSNWRSLLQTVAHRNRRPLIWQVLLAVGCEVPRSAQEDLVALLTQPGILASRVTLEQAAAFMNVVFPTLPPATRERIETTILGLEAPDDAAMYEAIKNELIGGLAEEHLVTPAARRYAETVRTARAARAAERDEAARQQALTASSQDHDAPSITDLQMHQQAVSAFVQASWNAPSDLHQVSEILVTVAELEELSKTAGPAAAQPAQTTWLLLVQACKVAASWASQLSDDQKALVRRILLKASGDPSPTSHPGEDAEFDRSSIGIPSPRSEAAAGLMILLARLGRNDEVEAALDGLTTDEAPTVRLQIAEHALAWHDVDPQRFWHLVWERLEHERSAAVLTIWAREVCRFEDQDPARVVEFARRVAERTCGQEGARDLGDVVGVPVARLALRQGRADALGLVDEWTGAFWEFGDLVTAVAGEALSLLGEEEADGTVWRRAQSTLAALITRMGATWSEDLERSQDSDTTLERQRPTIRLADFLAARMLSVSGGLPGGEARAARPTVYGRMAPLLETLATALPGGPIVHGVMQTLVHCAEVDPLAVFLQAGRVLHAGRTGEYQHDQLAMDLVVSLVERYLAAHMGLLRESPAAMATLIDILDSFVQAGWPKAARLTYRLGDLYR